MESVFSFETIQLNRRGEVEQHSTGENRQSIETLPDGVPLEMVSVPAGFFQMGSRGEGGYEDEMPVHPVFLNAFWIGKYPVTQRQWRAVMGRLPDCRFHGEDLPVDTICWRDAAAFCERLSKAAGVRYALPSEAQWEYACRAGTTGPFSFGETLTTDAANFVGEHTYREAPAGVYRHGTTNIGSFPPNRWGIYDMHGNVWEFCADGWSENYLGAPVDGSAHMAASGSSRQARPFRLADLFSSASRESNRWGGTGTTGVRVARGGSWHEPPLHCRSAVRLKVAEDDRMEYYGLRIVRAAEVNK
jgi:formylglycine-generating enzyme required for sulfatase activity